MQPLAQSSAMVLLDARIPLPARTPLTQHEDLGQRKL